MIKLILFGCKGNVSQKTGRNGKDSTHLRVPELVSGERSYVA